ncbi:MAG: thiamine phosphate synthase, partial [Deltaproteobacteria bacterium]|nr:thiamine phosphate synthase [Deltaproteobacteria bacterium]
MSQPNPTEGRRTDPILCLVVDRAAVRGELANCIAAAVAAGVDWVQIRERELQGCALLAHAEEIAAAAREAAARRGARVKIFVNRRIDIALALAADGVQLGFDAVDPATARRLLPAGAAIGISTHHPDEVRAAPPGVDYAQLAPIGQPLSKPHAGPYLGVRAVAEAADCGIPVIAQGGISAANAAAIVAAGAAGIAVTGAILSAP